MSDTITKEKTDTETDEKTSHYPMYKVIFHNDNKTPFNFVISVLLKWFNKNLLEAKNLAMEVHETGFGLAGVYIYEQAEFKVDQVKSLARSHGFPLALSIEPA